MADNLSDPLNGYNEKVVLAQAREMAHGGYLAAGFRYINLDGTGGVSCGVSWSKLE